MSRPLDFFPYKNGSLSVGGVSLDKVADQVGTPCYVYSAEAFLKPLKEFQKGLRGLDHTVCFAVKSNSSLAVIRLLSQAGAGVDLVSGGELYRAELAGLSPDQIVFSGVGKTPGEMATALQYKDKGIFSFNVESVAELAALSSVAESLDTRARVALRFNPDVDPKTHPYISTGLKKNKFGMSREEVLQIGAAIESFPNIDFQGISIHIGSQLLSLSPLNDAFARVRALVGELNQLLPQPISYVDLGGGLGVAYKNEKPPRIADYCKLVHKHFGRKSSVGGKLKILIEPGRALTANSGVLLTEVLYRKIRKEKDFLIVDAAMNDLLRPSLYEAYHDIVPVRRDGGKPSLKRTDIVGPVCETGDCFATDRKLSKEINQGDLVAILSAGAYGFTMSGNYNSRPRPCEVLVNKGKIRVIRERETYEDLVRGESW